MVSVGLAVGMVVCAVLAIRAARLLISALWLALTSALLSVLLYLLGGREIAVIELSVGAGLVTVLFVFALNMIGEERTKERILLPKPLAWGLVFTVLLMIGLMALPLLSTSTVPPTPEPSFSIMLWEQRGIDALMQISLIFAGVLAVLGLLAGTRNPQTAATEAAVPEQHHTDKPESGPEQAPEIEKTAQKTEKEESYA